MKAERGKETMASKFLMSCSRDRRSGTLLKILKTHESPALATEETPPNFCIPRIYLRLRSRRNVLPIVHLWKSMYSVNDLVVKIRLRHTINFALSIHLLSVWVLHEHRKRYGKLGPSQWYNYPSVQPVTLKQSLRHVEKSM